MRGRLKYKWNDAITRLETTPQPFSFRQMEKVLASAKWFVNNHALEAESAGMQPAHLFKYDPPDEEGRGLAWRMEPQMGLVCFPRASHLIMDLERWPHDPLLFVYRFEPDGRTILITGDERAEILAADIDPAAQPTFSQRAGA